MDITPSSEPTAAETRYTPFGTARLYWKEYLTVFIVYCAVFSFIFRDLLMALPDIWSGKTVVSFDEMVPIFDMKSQFWDQVKGQFSDLTNEYEFRVRYSVLTTWMRYYSIVPITIVASIAVSSFLNFMGLTVFLGNMTKIAPRKLLPYACAMSVLLFNLILTYSKITHFYTLILGFNLFCISLFLLLSAVFLARKRSTGILVVANLTAVINPAVHYVVLYCIVYALLSLFIGYRSGASAFLSQKAWKRIAGMNALLVGCTIVPYVILTKFFFLSGFGELSDAVPVNHFLIESTSIPLLKQLSLDIVSIVDKYIYGEYNVPFARIANFFYVCVALIPLLPSFRRMYVARGGNGSLLTFLAVLLPFSVWFTFGYTQNPYIPTFHNMLSAFVNMLYPIPSVFAEAVVKVCSMLIQVLRFPHRFQFITFAVVMTLLPVGILFVADRIKEATRYEQRRMPLRLVMVILSTLLFFVPFLSNWDYRTALFSGNLNNLVTPYPLADLESAKQSLRALPTGKTVVFPPSEAEKRVLDENGVAHRFIDKFFIYYLNLPSYYFGASGDVATKNIFFSLLWSLLQGGDAWLDTLKEQDIRYIVINKQTVSTAVINSTYLSQLKSALQDNMDDMPTLFNKKYENSGYAVYEFNPAALSGVKEDASAPWTSLLCTDQEILQKNRDIFEVEDAQKKTLDTFAEGNPAMFFRPDLTNQAFSDKIVPSTLYFGTIYSMFSVLNYGKYNFLRMIIPGTFDTVTGSFLGMPEATTVKIPLAVPADGEYAVYVRAIPTHNALSVSIPGVFTKDLPVNSRRTTYIDTSTIRSYKPRIVDISGIKITDLPSYIPQKILPISSTYSYLPLGTMRLEKGRQRLILEKDDGNPFVLEGALIVPEGTPLPSPSQK